ncbi:glycosyltransferase family 2 protein [Saccharospirillum alexandrii]|uniref:glycosyltransferase family 2 protein n=1 Tax=Saccharospirillum alexandrii TaxID=2448477 RepID=UPI000FD72E90|nr:glycosyltransferase [Saccharospirillum alexandrii]
MSNTPTLSVILCTYNNADSLAVTLGQLVQCEVERWSDVEILVVDNNSPDNTEEVVRKVSESSEAQLQYYFEQKQGLSIARNLGVEKARGEYLLFTDDDADIPTNWLSSYLQKIESTQADCLFSKIEVNWDRTPPWWFDQRYNPYFVQLDYGDSPMEITDIHHEFFGKNFCCRKPVLAAMGGFDEKLGRNGTSLAAGEETIIYRRLVAMSAKVTYFPDAIVGHRLKPIEYTSRNIEKKFVDGASSSLRIAQCFSNNYVLGRPTYPLKMAIKNTVKSLLLIPISIVPMTKKAKREAFYQTLQLKRSVRMIWLWTMTP